MPTDNDKEPTQNPSAEGPGEERMQPRWIVLVALYLVFVSLVVLYGLIKLWPYPTPSGTRNDQTASNQQNSSPQPTPTASPTPSTTGTNTPTPVSSPPRQIGNPSPTPTPTTTTTSTPTPASTSSATPTGPPQIAGVKAPCVSSTPKPGAEKALPDPECISFLGTDPVPIYLETRLLLLVMLSGALGSLMHSLRSLYWYTGNRMMVWSWVAFYLLLPLTGAILAVIFYFVVRGGFFSPQSSFDQTSPFGFAALSALVGLFSPQATLKLKEIAETIFSKPAAGSDNKPQESSSQAPTSTPTITSVTPTSGVAKDSVVISGTGFSDGAVVKFGGVAAQISSSTATSIAAVVPENAAAAASGPQEVEVVVTNADGQSAAAAKFTYTGVGTTDAATVDERDGHDEIKSNTTDEELPITEGGVE